MSNIFEIIELIISEDMMSGVQAISLVTEGAIERDFMHFNKEHVVKLAIQNEEKRMVMGPILVPNKMILRAYEEAGKAPEYFYVHFSPETVRKTAQRFMELGNQKKATYQHAMDIDGVTFVETWVKDFPKDDKSTGYGYGDMPVGTWFGIARIDNDDVWKDVKAGKINGFSIEGHFADSILKQSILEPELDIEKEEDINILIDILKLLDAIDNDENTTE